MADQTKTERRTAKRLFTMAINQLTKSINEKKPMDTIQIKYDTFKQRMNDVQEKHAIFLSNTHDDDSEPTQEETEWLENIETQADLMEKTFYQHVKANQAIRVIAPVPSVPSLTSAVSTQSADKKKASSVCQYEATNTRSYT